MDYLQVTSGSSVTGYFVTRKIVAVAKFPRIYGCSSI